MRQLGKILFGMGLGVMLVPIITGAVIFFMAPHMPGMISHGGLKGLLMALALGAAFYGPIGLVLVVSGAVLVYRANVIRFGRRRRYRGRSMQYQLALHFQGEELPDHEAMSDLQRDLTQVLGASATLAGHDMGSSATTVFIHTANAKATFKRCKPVLARLKAFAGVTAAYRLLDEETYNILWPQQFRGPFALA
ncbi:MAG: hypothetical protein V4484_11005 [Pseudomonadota bacterium]